MAHKGEVKAIVTTVIVSFSFTDLLLFLFLLRLKSDSYLQGSTCNVIKYV